MADANPRNRQEARKEKEEEEEEEEEGRELGGQRGPGRRVGQKKKEWYFLMLVKRQGLMSHSEATEIFNTIKEFLC